MTFSLPNGTSEDSARHSVSAGLTGKVWCFVASFRLGVELRWDPPRPSEPALAMNTHFPQSRAGHTPGLAPTIQCHSPRPSVNIEALPDIFLGQDRPIRSVCGYRGGRWFEDVGGRRDIEVEGLVELWRYGMGRSSAHGMKFERTRKSARSA